jgi:hypothetical protein
MANVRLRVVSSLAACAATMVLSGVAGAAVQFQLKLDKGKTYYQRTTTEQKIIQTIMGQEQVTQVSMGNGQKLEVLDVDPQGNMQVRYTHIWTRIKQISPMVQLDYDSSAQGPTPTGAEGFAALIGESYTARLSPLGKVLDVNGVEQLAAAVRKKLLAGAEGSPAMSALAPYFDPQGVKEMTQTWLPLYPGRPVEVGDSWTDTKALTQGFGMVIQSTWTLQKQQAGVATIDTTASIQADPNAPGMETQGMKVKFTVSGTQQGTVLLDEATGLATKTDMKQQLKGETKVGATADGPPMMVIPMTIDSQVTGEISDQMWKSEAQ